jgi:Transposase domain (DUF772)
MSEVGLVPFARVALEVGREVLPAYSHRFSPQRFTQPQLLSVLCLMRYEEWTFRAAEIRLAEHGELRRALELQAVPDHSTLFRFMLRLDERVIEQAVAEVVRRLQSPRPAPSEEKSTVAVDATGLAPGAISTFLVVDASTTAALLRRIATGSNGSWLSTPVAASSWHRRPITDRPTTARLCLRCSRKSLTQNRSSARW